MLWELNEFVPTLKFRNMGEFVCLSDSIHRKFSKVFLISLINCPNLSVTDIFNDSESP